MIEIGDRIKTYFGKEGIVIEKISLGDLLSRDGHELDPDGELDLPYLVFRTDAGVEFDVCEYECNRIG
jgi:hypothetical protein